MLGDGGLLSHLEHWRQDAQGGAWHLEGENLSDSKILLEAQTSCTTQHARVHSPTHAHMAQDDFLRYNLVGPDADHSDVDQAPPEKTKEAVITAVKAGYRMLDCANDYDNEHVIGEALKELFAAGVVKREELFVQVC